MNYPLSVSNAVPNNVLMQPDVQGEYDLDRAGQQWSQLYRELARSGIVYLLPGHDGLQDLPFVANLGVYLPNRQHPTVILSRFVHESRRGEQALGLRFFEAFDYLVMQPPGFFEGEADLKWIGGDKYVGGVGRSVSNAYKWMSGLLGLEITEVELLDPGLYHLDCVFMPLGSDKALVNVSVLSSQAKRALEKVCDIVAVPKEYVYEGWTNCIRIGQTLLHSPGAAPAWRFQDFMNAHGFGVKVLQLDEFDKSGADLSCLVMHLNYR